MAHQFPDIATYGSALRFALVAEQACADFAAAAGVLAPDQTWRDKLEEIVCTHDDRVQKLTALSDEMGTRANDPVGLDRGTYLGTLDAEPVTGWPAAAEQLAQAEEAAAEYHEAFVAQCDSLPEAGARAFEKSAKQDRDAAQQLRGHAGLAAHEARSRPRNTKGGEPSGSPPFVIRRPDSSPRPRCGSSGSARSAPGTRPRGAAADTPWYGCRRPTRRAFLPTQMITCCHSVLPSTVLPR